MRPLKVVFVCVGNSCRSQMAEAFARVYGSDVMQAASAGLAPATVIAPLTRTVMKEKNIDLEAQFPKGLEGIRLSEFDLVINLSGYPLPQKVVKQERRWNVRDPIGEDERIFRQVAQEIENLVMQLVLELRRLHRHWPTSPPPPGI